MMKKVIFMLVLMVLASVMTAAGAVDMSHLKNPASMQVVDGKIYINDGAVIYVYSAKDMKLVHRFGRKGEGPGEFKVHPSIHRGGVSFHVTGEEILVSSMGRLSYFDGAGKYLGEGNSRSPFLLFYRVGGRLAGLGIDFQQGSQYLALCFYDKTFNKGKPFYRSLVFEEGKPLDPVSIGIFPRVYVVKDRIFANGDDGAIHVYNKEGKEVHTLRLAEAGLKKQPVTPERKARYIDFFKSDYRFKAQFERDEKRFKFPAHFPLLRDYTVSGDDIYAVSYRENKEGTLKEMLRMTVEGKPVIRHMVPLHEYNPRELMPYAVSEGKLYQLVDNPETEEWELRVTPLDS